MSEDHICDPDRRRRWKERLEMGLDHETFRAKLQIECDLFKIKHGAYPLEIHVSQSAHDLLTKGGQIRADYFGDAPVTLCMPEPTPAVVLWLGGTYCYRVWKYHTSRATNLPQP